MFFIAANAFVSAVLFVLVVVPPLYIYDPAKHPGESHGPPTAGEVILTEDLSHSVKQKLYMLFMVPACATVNILFLYFTYYRPVRGVQYRVEVNVLSLHDHRQRARQQLQARGFTGVPAATSTFSFALANSSFLVPSSRSITQRALMGPGGGGDLKGEEAGAEPRVKADFSRRARPRNVAKDTYKHSSFYPEVRRLMDVVERCFLTPASACERNFAKAVSQLTGEATPGAANAPTLIGNAPFAPAGFYSSKREHVTGATADSSGSDAHEPVSSSRVPAVGKRRSSPIEEGLRTQRPKRSSSVVLLLSDRVHGRRGASVPGTQQ